MGRVVTLLPRPEARVWGVAYRPPAQQLRDIMARLDHREQGGYAHARVQVRTDDGSNIDALTYIATEQNPFFLGARPLEVMAQRIARAHGPSGPNRAYLFALEEALERAQAHDPHVTRLARAVRAVLAEDP